MKKFVILEAKDTKKDYETKAYVIIVAGYTEARHWMINHLDMSKDYVVKEYK